MDGAALSPHGDKEEGGDTCPPVGGEEGAWPPVGDEEKVWPSCLRRERGRHRPF